MSVRSRILTGAVLCASLLLIGCGSLVSIYDATFDQSLNKFSEDTAKFVAAASAGSSERSYASKEAVAYYASAYNLLDRLSDRARLSRGLVACPTNATLKDFSETGPIKVALPDEYLKFDCREYQLAAIRIYVAQLEYAHKNDGILNRSEAKAAGGILQTSILGSIQTFIANKPAT